jgi:hypothetical protein
MGPVRDHLFLGLLGFAFQLEVIRLAHFPPPLQPTAAMKTTAA